MQERKKNKSKGKNMLLYVQCYVLSVTEHFLPVGVELADID